MQYHTKLIVVATDFSENALHALKASVDLLHIPKTRLVVVHISENADEEYLHEMNIKLDSYVKNFFNYNEPEPLPERLILFNQTAYKAILDYVNKTEPYLLVVGAKGSSKIKNLHVGSTTLYLIDKSNCPVIVVPIPKI